MEQNFQTSFIPKKPMIEQPTVVTKRPIGLVSIISIFIFVTMVLASGGAYLYKNILIKNVTQMENDLNLAKNRFEPAKISLLQSLDKRLQSASEILANHISVSPIFESLETLTIKTIRYTKFDYSLTDSKILVKMSGTAIGYRSIALQADLFAKNKNIIDPSFSNLSLDDKGNVLFDLQFSVDPSFVNYKQVQKTTGGNPSPSNTAVLGTVN
jgi:hypothetical protein